MFKIISTAAVTILIASSFNPAQAALIRFDFIGTTFSTFGVPNAGTTVSGFLTFDPFGLLEYGFPGGARYFQSAPATFFFTTNAGFVLQQTMTRINIADEFANGASDYYVFDADVGAFSSSTNFSRLELTLSNNQNPFIPNPSIPTTPPDFSAFQFHTVAFFGFTGNTASQRVEANLTSLTADVPEPENLSLYASILCFLVMRKYRNRDQHTVRRPPSAGRRKPS